MIQVLDRIEPLAERWEALADALRAPPWLRPDWFIAWGDAFGPVEWRVHALERDGRLEGVVPLVRGRLGLAAAANWHTPEFGPLALQGARATLAEAVLARAPSSVSLSFVDRDAPELVAWERAAARRGHRVLTRTLERSPYIDLEGGWAAYEARLGAKRRAELRRRRRRLEERGPVVVEIADGRGGGLERLLAEGFAVEASGWKGERGSAIAARPSTARFYRHIANWAAARGWLRLAFLRVGGRAIAFDFALEDGRVHALLKTGFRPELRELAPGTLLRREMIARAFAVGVERYDFLGADEPWKLDWTAAVRERCRVQTFAPSVVGQLGWRAYAHGRPLARRLVGTVRR
jgi:CelD/BcsL family acetyltransferase involved in cellulose biosynthesis